MSNEGRPPNKRCCFAVLKRDWQGRLDTQFYLPKHRELERRMDSSGYPVHTVGSPDIATQVVDGPFGSDLKVEEYSQLRDRAFEGRDEEAAKALFKASGAATWKEGEWEGALR